MIVDMTSVTSYIHSAGIHAMLGSRKTVYQYIIHDESYCENVKFWMTPIWIASDIYENVGLHCFLYVYNTFYSLLYAKTGKVLTQSRNRLETDTSITNNVYRLQLLDLGADINDTHRNAGTILRLGIWRFSEAWWKQCHQNNIGLPLNVIIDTPYWILVNALFHGKCGCDFKSTNLTKHNLGIAILSIQVHIRLEWLSEDLVDG